MEVSLNIVLDELKNMNIENHAERGDVRFAAVNMFSARPRELHDGIIYVGMLSHVLSSELRSSSHYCIAVRDRVVDELESPERMCNIVVINSNVDPMDVFETVQFLFGRLYRWDSMMKDYIIHNRGMEELLRLSENVIGNYITISDSAMGLMAHTAGLKVDCPVTNALVENGYHNEESVALFRRYHLPEAWINKGEIYINDSRTISPYPNMCKVVRYNNCYFAHVIMICSYRSPSPGLVDLFQMLLDNLMVCFERQWNNEGKPVHVYDSLIASLIEDSLPGDILEERAAHCSLPMKANFRLAKISCNSGGPVLLQRMAQDISGYITGARVTVFRDSIVVLIVNRHSNEGSFEESLGLMSEHMERYEAGCGLSNPFGSLHELHLAGIQADVALRYGPDSVKPGREQRRTGIFHFEDCYPGCIMCANEETMSISTSTGAYKALEKLIDYDKQHGSNNVELLYNYLSNDRKATETAALMHMHRNNVIYRVGRICEIIGMDLDDSRSRFSLLLAYELPRGGR